MINKELLLFIQAQLALGTPDAVIKELLTARGGWRTSDVEEAFRSIQNPIPSVPVVAPTPTPILEIKTEPITIEPQPQPPQQQPAPVRMPATTLVTEVNDLLPKTIPVTKTPVVASLEISAPQPQPQPQPITPIVNNSPEPVATQTPVTDIKPPISKEVYYQPAQTTPAQTFSGMKNNQIDTVSQPRSVGKKIAIVLGVLCLMGFLGGGLAYGYFFYYNPTPQVAFNNVVSFLSKTKTGQIQTTITAEFDAMLLDSLKTEQVQSSQQGIAISEDTSSLATIVLDTAFDRTLVSSPKISTVADITTTTPLFSLSLETKFIDSVLYAKVPDLGFLTDLLGGNTGVFLPGDWVSFESSDTTDIAATLLSFSDIQRKIAQLFVGADSISPTVKLTQGSLNGTSVHRYQFSVDQQKLQQLMSDPQTVSDIAGPEAVGVREMIGDFSIVDGEIWIGVWDRKPYRMLFTVKPSNTASVANIKFDILFTSFGNPVSIESPASVKSFSLLFQDAQKKAQDNAIAAMLTSVKPTAQIYYASKRTYVGLCTSPDGLKNLFEAMTSQVLSESPYCKDGAKGYAVAANLATQTGVSCVDTNANIVSLETFPTGVECK